MKRLVLLLPPLFLLLSFDRILPDADSAPPIRQSKSLANVLTALPGSNVGRFGRTGNPLNLVFVGDPASVREALREAGWTEIPLTVRASLAAGVGELLSGRALAAGLPMNDYKLGGRRQDMNWTIPVRSIEERHHFRLWDTGWRDAAGRTVWWGAGDYDLSIRWYTLGHVRDPDIDRERDFIADTLRGGARVESVELAALPQIPPSGMNDQGYLFHSDRRAAVVTLRHLERSTAR